MTFYSKTKTENLLHTAYTCLTDYVSILLHSAFRLHMIACILFQKCTRLYEYTSVLYHSVSRLNITVSVLYQIYTRLDEYVSVLYHSVGRLNTIVSVLYLMFTRLVEYVGVLFHSDRLLNQTVGILFPNEHELNRVGLRLFLNGSLLNPADHTLLKTKTTHYVYTTLLISNFGLVNRSAGKPVDHIFHF